VKYGDTRQTNVEAVIELVEEMVPRICIGLPGTAMGIDDAAADDLQELMLDAQRAISLLSQAEPRKRWADTLDQMAKLNNLHPLISGTCVRLGFERGTWTSEATGRRLNYALSNAQAPLDAASWIDGFLYGNGLLLIHQPMLWREIDQWVSQLTVDRFSDILPILRRAFSRFSASERAKMLRLAQLGIQSVPAPLVELNLEAPEVKGALSMMRSILTAD
jgi:hypothetical protein